jgi:hypothetical protein
LEWRSTVISIRGYRVLTREYCGYFQRGHVGNLEYFLTRLLRIRGIAGILKIVLAEFACLFLFAGAA